MSFRYRLVSDLLNQASELLDQDVRRPKQATLRRAISTCYYAVFHYTIIHSVDLILSDTYTKSIAYRTIDHKHLKEVCSKVLKNGFIRLGYARANFSSEFVSILDSFIQLQEARLESDYDLNSKVSKQKAVAMYVLACRYVADWESLSGQNPKLLRAFATHILFKSREG